MMMGGEPDIADRVRTDALPRGRRQRPTRGPASGSPRGAPQGRAGALPLERGPHEPLLLTVAGLCQRAPGRRGQGARSGAANPLRPAGWCVLPCGGDGEEEWRTPTSEPEPPSGATRFVLVAHRRPAGLSGVPEQHLRPGCGKGPTRRSSRLRHALGDIVEWDSGGRRQRLRDR
jgi:hypothetical protein